MRVVNSSRKRENLEGLICRKDVGFFARPYVRYRGLDDKSRCRQMVKRGRLSRSGRRGRRPLQKNRKKYRQIGTARTPSPTEFPKKYQRIGTSRTPSPTVKSKKCRRISSNSISSEESAGKRNLSDNSYNDARF